MNSPASVGIRRHDRPPLQRRRRGRKNGIWTDSQLKATLVAVNDGNSMKKAAKETNISYLSLRDCCCGNLGVEFVGQRACSQLQKRVNL
jgi:hypothetical protein